MRPLRAARSSSFTAWSLASGVEPAACAFLRAVRIAERCARFRTCAARDLRMFLFAEAILGTESSCNALYEIKQREHISARSRDSRGTNGRCQGVTALWLVLHG